MFKGALNDFGLWLHMRVSVRLMSPRNQRVAAMSACITAAFRRDMPDVFEAVAEGRLPLAVFLAGLSAASPDDNPDHNGDGDTNVVRLH